MAIHMLGAQGTKVTQADWEKVANFVHPHSVTDTIEVAGGAYSGTFVHRGVEGEIADPISVSAAGNFIRRGSTGLEAGTGEPLPDDLYVWDGTSQRSVRGYGEVSVRGVRGNETHPTLVTEPGQRSNVYAEYRGGKQVQNTAFISRTDQDANLSAFEIYPVITNVNGTGVPSDGGTLIDVDHEYQVAISSGLRITHVGLTYELRPLASTHVVGIAFRSWPGTLETVVGEGATFSITGGLNNASPLTLKLSPKIWELGDSTFRIAHFYRVNGTSLAPLLATAEQDVSVSMQIITRH